MLTLFPSTRASELRQPSTLAPASALATAFASHDAYWNLVESSPQGIFYCHKWWLDAVCPGQYEVLTVERNGQLEAAWPIVWRKVLGLRFIGMPPLTQKLGILFAPPAKESNDRPSHEHSLVAALLRKLPLGTRVVGHRFHEHFKNWSPLYWAGCRQSTFYTYTLDAREARTTLWENLRPSFRRNVKKAQRLGIRVRETDDLDLFYRLQSSTYSRQKMANPVPRKLADQIYAACKKNANVRITIAEDPQGRVHGALFAPYNSRCMVSLMSGSDPELRNSNSGVLLHWDAIEFANTTCQRFDFEGSMIKPIEEFYRGFGASLTPYSSVSGVLRPHPPKKLRRRLGEMFRVFGDQLG